MHPMTSTFRRLGSLAPLMLLFSCADSHAVLETDSGQVEVDAGPPDAGPVVMDAAPLPVDSGLPPDAGSECGLLRPDSLCIEGALPRAGEPFELPLLFHNRCYCEEVAHCDVTVDRARRTIVAETRFCEQPAACFACVPDVTATCSVPALEPGDWALEVNGAPATELEIAPPTAPEFMVAGCTALASPSPCGGAPSLALPGAQSQIETFCISRLGTSERYLLDLRESCYPCPSALGTCGVVSELRLTDDLPHGYDLHIDARHFDDGCDGACPPGCFERQRDCITPELEPGATYRVIQNGVVLDTFVLGNEPHCNFFPQP